MFAWQLATLAIEKDINDFAWLIFGPLYSLSLSMAYRLPIIVRSAAHPCAASVHSRPLLSSQQCLRAFEWSLHLCREQLHKRELYYVVILLENYVFICAERSCDVMLSSSSSTPPSMFTLSQRKQEIGALNAWCCQFSMLTWMLEKNLKFAGKPSKVWPFCFDQLDCLKRLNYPSMKREPLVLRNCGTLKQKWNASLK